MIGRLYIPLDQAIRCYLTLAEVFGERKLFGTSPFKMTKLEEILKKIVRDATGDENTQMLDTRPDADKCRT
jgi:chromatin remodeling complex protein RSC6